MHSLGGVGSNIAYIAGTIAEQDTWALQKILFRASKGKVLVYFADQPLKPLNSDKPRLVYLIVFEKRGDYLMDYVHRIC